MTVRKPTMIMLMLYLVTVMCDSGSTLSARILPSQETGAKRDIEFSFVKGATGRTKDGVRVSTVMYNASDGIAVSATTEERGSPVRANKELRRRMVKAIKILGREPIREKDGKIVGTRVVIMFQPKRQQKAQFAVIWTDGSELHSIEAISLQHVLKLEGTF
ncbi:MAG: hypothetical protein ND895_05405 [Pyrinomonadaceae bacterium]|nr:hypothetical protein [Pyrinomonadaceae bacterium]